jgi:hypothetical protein
LDEEQIVSDGWIVDRATVVIWSQIVLQDVFAITIPGRPDGLIESEVRVAEVAHRLSVQARFR